MRRRRAWAQPAQQQPAETQPQQSYGAPQQPFGAPQQQYGAPQQQWQPAAAGAYGAPPPRQRSKVPLIIGIVAAAMVLVIVLAVVLQSQARSRAEQQEREEAQARVDGAAGSVQGVFDAIVAGDAATALSYLRADGNQEMLTDEVLAASAEIAPITDVVVTPPAEISVYTSFAEVEVSYRLGETDVQQTYQVTDTDADGSWVVDGVLASYYLYDLDASTGLTLLLNGAAVTNEEFLLFPGAYEFTTTTTYFTLGDSTAFEVTDPYVVESPTLEPALTKDGIIAFRQAVSDAVDACVASKKLETGCGLSLEKELSDGTVLKDGTIERSLTSDAKQTIKTMKPTLSYDNWVLAQGEYIGGVDVVAEGTYEGEQVKGDIIFPPSLGTPSVDMTDPELTVMWD